MDGTGAQGDAATCLSTPGVSAFSNLPQRDWGARNTKTLLDEHYFEVVTVFFST